MSWRGITWLPLPASGRSARAYRTVFTLVGCAVISTAATVDAAGDEDPPETPDRPAMSDAARQSLQRSEPAIQPDTRVGPDGRLSTVARDPSRYGFSEEAIEEGRVVAVQADRSVVMEAGDFGSRIDPGTIFVERVRPEARETAAPAALAAPESQHPVTDYKLGFVVTAFEAQTEKPLKLDVWARDSTGLALQGSSARFVGQFNVALTLRNNPNDRSALASPVNVAVAALGATIEPKPVVISRLGLWHDVSIAVPSVEGDTYEISLSADPTNPGDPIALSVMRPEARLWSTPPSIIGWGIGESTVFVEATGLRRPEGLPVALRAVNGSLSAGRVTLDSAGQAQVKLRSSRHPRATVEIMSSALQGEPLVIPFTSPWWFVGSAVAGGLAGAFLRGRGRRHWLMAMAIGVVAAVVMCLAYAIGIDWPARVLATAGIPRASEAAVFVLGALGALVGVSIVVPNLSKT